MCRRSLHPGVAGMTVEERRARQIAHIQRHLREFQEHQCHLPPYGDSGEAGVVGYFHDYADDPDLYYNLCNDLGIEPED